MAEKSPDAIIKIVKMTPRSTLLALVLVPFFAARARSAEILEGRPVEGPAAPAAALPQSLASPLDRGQLTITSDLSVSAPGQAALALPASVPAAAAQAAQAVSAAASAPATASAAASAPQASVTRASPGMFPKVINDPRPLVADADVRGKTLLLVGTRGSRPFIIEEAVRVARELGLNLVLLDKEESRGNSADLVPDENFVAAPIDKRDDKTVKSIVEQVAALKASRPIDYVMSFRSHHAKLVGKIVDGTGIKGVSGKVALTAEDKVKTRKALNVDPAQRVAYREVKSEDEVRAFWRENVPQSFMPGFGPEDGAYRPKFVMKSKLGENSRFVELDIDTEEKMVAAFQKMNAALRAEAKKKESSDTIFNRFPGIMVERMLEKAPGTFEASVEMVVQDGKVKFAMVSDTHGIGKNGELAGGSLTFSSQMTPQVQEALIEASAHALEIVGLRDGNARTDIMMTPEGPKIIEINPFLGGAAIFTAVKIVSGVSLVEWGIRAMLGLALPEMPPFTKVVDYRFAASHYNGEVAGISGVAEAKAVPGVAHVQILEGPGTTVAAPIENGFEEWAEVMGTGPTFGEARRASIEALKRIKAKVVVEQTADHLQPKP